MIGVVWYDFSLKGRDLTWKMIHVHLKRTYILLLLGEMSWKISTKSIWSNRSLRALFLLIFCLNDLPIDVQVLYFYCTTVDLSLSSFRWSYIGSINVYKLQHFLEMVPFIIMSLVPASVIYLFVCLFVYAFMRERKREASICCSAYLCIHPLLLVCALIGDQTCNPGILGWCANQLRYLAGA